MSLSTAETRAWVGQSIEFSSDPITIGEVKRFVAASGDDNPGYIAPAGEDLADGTPVPPMLYYAVTRPFAPGAEFSEDGTVFEHRPMVGQGQTMGGGVEVEWLRPIRLGDRLFGRRTLASLEEKQGRRRHFVRAEWVTEYRDAAGELVVRERYEQILF